MSGFSTGVENMRGVGGSSKFDWMGLESMHRGFEHWGWAYNDDEK